MRDYFHCRYYFTYHYSGGSTYTFLYCAVDNIANGWQHTIVNYFTQPEIFFDVYHDGAFFKRCRNDFYSFDSVFIPQQKGTMTFGRNRFHHPSYEYSRGIVEIDELYIFNNALYLNGPNIELLMQ